MSNFYIFFIIQGVATLKVKVSCESSTGGIRFMTYKVKLGEFPEILINLISQDLSISSNYIKLISAGKLLSPERTLSQQGVKNFQQIMALIMKVDREEACAENEPYDRVQKIKKDAEILMKTQNGDYFKVISFSLYSTGETLFR